MSHPLDLTEEWDPELRSTDPLSFPGYRPPTADSESVRTGVTRFGGTDVAVIECRFDHMGGTMGAVAGERIVRAFERATRRRLPLGAIVASGGARLQEGMVSLIQMARTTSAVSTFSKAGLLWSAIYTPHTTGGVYASWASLADVRGARSGATIGFSGPRVVAEATGNYPPPNSHTAESAYTHGLVDALVSERDERDWLGAVLTGVAPALQLPPGRPLPPAIRPVHNRGIDLLRSARRAGRPSGLEWAAWLSDGWVELRGNDPAIRAGLAAVGGQRVMVVAMDRHAHGDAKARPGPAAYRLAQRALRLADRLGLAVLTIIDTPGADPGPAAEADGIAGEIARTLLAMAELRVPSVALCVGEGGSGGAMALAHADHFLMLDDSVFSVIGPEAGAAILYRDSSRAPELALALRMGANDLLGLGIIDQVITNRAGCLDPVACTRDAVYAALVTAEVGHRDRRSAAATNRSITERYRFGESHGHFRPARLHQPDIG